MRLIDADKEIRHYERDYLCPTPDVKDFEKRNAIIIVNALKKMETVESRPKGKWIDNYSARNEEGFWRCSVCGREISLYNSTEKERTEKYPYCHCGADMRGK